MKTKLQATTEWTNLATHRAIAKKAWYIAYRYTKNTKSRKYGYVIDAGLLHKN